MAGALALRSAIDSRRFLTLGGIAAAVLVIAAALSISPVVTIGGAAALLVGAFTLRFRTALPWLCIDLVAALLAGYALFGRTFAYIGYPPLYVGEAVLLVGLLALITTRSRGRLPASPLLFLITAFAVCGAAQTIPYIGVWGMDALRDAVLWGYGAFAIVVASCLVKTNGIPVLLHRYRRFIVAYVLLMPALGIASIVLGDDALPTLPFGDVPLLTVKMGDVGVHLAGAAAFVLAFSHVPAWCLSAARRRVFWGFWAVAMVPVLIRSRGGFVAVLAALAVTAVLDLRRSGARLLVAGTAVALLAGPPLLIFANENQEADVAGDSQQRALTPGQLVANVLSVFDPDFDPVLGGTRQWRVDWWNTIVDYTVHGQYFWTGKGFGINLADDDGFQVDPDGPLPLRSPHSAHLSVLARAGVPGLVLWIALQVTFALMLCRGYLRARRGGLHLWAAVDLWLLSYWTAFIVNASFDVFLEGPQGGIWFWCVIGAGIAALECQRWDERARVAQSLAS